ncbi:MAG: family 78 glycoside hydrolase catalytic domain [Spirochaetes bacterium]|nr:family 78 glycoside hydrolase catalytic domain [Spirochaetota bacterium]
MTDKRMVPHRWQAQWIWKRGEDAVKNSYYFFRREITSENTATNARVFISASTRYELFINGSLAGRGPVPGQPYHQYYDVVDISGLLTSGKNTVGVVVNFTGKYEGTRGGLIAEIDCGGERIVSDDSWRVTRAQAWNANTHHIQFNQVACYQEHFDARKSFAGWNIPGFDDAGWEKAAIIPELKKWTTLVARDIPFMHEHPVFPAAIAYTEECLDVANRHRADDLSISLSAAGSSELRYSTIKDPDALLSGGYAEVMCSTKHRDGIFDGIYDPCIILDFGRVITARPMLSLTGAAGGIVDIGYAERLIDGRFNNAIECPFADRYTMTDGAQSWQPFAWKGFRYLKLRFRSCFTPVTVMITALITEYPYDERGQFSSGDDIINRVFAMSKYTLRLCSNDSIVDTPWREQGQWLGDVAAVTLPGIYSCFGDTVLPKKFLRQSAANMLPTGLIANMTNTIDTDYRNVIPDYSLWWVMALRDYYRYTGDADTLHEFYPHVLRIIQAHAGYIGAHGLIENMPYWVFIDWADIDKRGECAAYNALFYGALEAVAAMAAFRHDDYFLDMVNSMRSSMRENFQKRLFDDRRGVVFDACVDDVLSGKISEHANLAAIRWGLVSDEAAGLIIRHLYETKDVRYTEAQPFFTTVVLSALDRIGRTDIALRILKERWGDRMAARGFSSTLEEWYENGSWRSGEFKGFLRTHSHAWSACPAEFLIRTLSGFEIVEPGCTKVRISPKDAPFEYQVVIPTPLGGISVQKSIGRNAVVAVPEGITVVA